MRVSLIEELRCQICGGLLQLYTN